MSLKNRSHQIFIQSKLGKNKSQNLSVSYIELLSGEINLTVGRRFKASLFNSSQHLKIDSLACLGISINLN